jgi:hypothetical protein
VREFYLRRQGESSIMSEKEVNRSRKKYRKIVDPKVFEIASRRNTEVGAAELPDSKVKK